jgi:hypothetical protein
MATFLSKTELNFPKGSLQVSSSRDYRVLNRPFVSPGIPRIELTGLQGYKVTI